MKNINIAQMPELKIMMWIEQAHDLTRDIPDEISREIIWEALEIAHNVVQDKFLMKINGKH